MLLGHASEVHLLEWIPETNQFLSGAVKSNEVRVWDVDGTLVGILDQDEKSSLSNFQ